MAEIRTAVFGVGNCFSSLLQGIYFYSDVKGGKATGLMHPSLGGYLPRDIKFAAAFDIDARKVGRDLSEAVFALPNNTAVLYREIPRQNVKVRMGRVLDGVAEHMAEYPESRRFVVSGKREPEKAEIVRILKNSGVEIAVNYLPVGSQRAVEFYASCALEAGCGFVNCMPVFICSDAEWVKEFRRRRLPCIGDDIKAQAGATIVHRVLTKLFADRGLEIADTYQLNVGGNTDFLNMLSRNRLKTKRISKTEAVQSQLESSLPSERIHIGPSDYIPFLGDRKICFLKIRAREFMNSPVELRLELEVEDSPNSGGCGIDAIRACRLARDRGISGCLKSASAYLMKHPLKQYSDDEARRRFEQFISGKRKR